MVVVVSWEEKKENPDNNCTWKVAHLFAAYSKKSHRVVSDNRANQPPHPAR